MALDSSLWRSALRLTVVCASLILTLAACEAGAPESDTVPSPTAARPAPSPTAIIRSSGELYGDDARFGGRTAPRFASFPVDAALPPAPMPGAQGGVNVVLEDGTALRGQLHGIGLTRRPGILLLSENLAAWGAFPAQLSEAGLVVLALEAGESPRARQIETLLQSLSAITSVDGGRIGILGAAGTADLALIGCAVSALCDVAALISPLSRETLLNMMQGYGSRPLLLAAGRDDDEAHSAAVALAQIALGQLRYHELPAGRGVALLQAHPELNEQIIDFFTRHLAGGE